MTFKEWKEKKKKETVKTMVIPKGDTSMYLISSLEYELRMLQGIKGKVQKGKVMVPKISLS